MPEANGEAVTALIEEALRQDPRLTQTAIAERTAELPAPYSAISPKVLYSAKTGGSIERRNIETIAAMFSRLLGREIRPSELEASAKGATGSEAEDGARSTGPISQTVIVRGDEADGIAAAPGSTVSINRQTYRKDK